MRPARAHRRRRRPSRTPTCRSTRAPRPARASSRRRCSSTAPPTATRSTGATAVATLYSDASDRDGEPGGDAAQRRVQRRPGGRLRVRPGALGRLHAPGQSRPGRATSATARPGRSAPTTSSSGPSRRRPARLDRLHKVAIPQADEQQRLLANLIGTMNRRPQAAAALLVLPARREGGRGDDRRRPRAAAAPRAGSTPTRRRARRAARVADWECIRGTSYIYPNTPLTDAQAAAYEAQGFEVGAPRRRPAAPTGRPRRSRPTSPTSSPRSPAKYPSLAAPATNRTHCIAVERLGDAAARSSSRTASGSTPTTTTGPAAWVAGPPRHVHRLGHADAVRRPRRHDDRRLPGGDPDDRRVRPDVPAHIDTLLDKRDSAPRATTARSRPTCTPIDARSAGSDAIVASAKARGVPVVSARQMLTWLDGRNGSSFQGLAWAGNKLTFTISLGAGASNLQAMVPTVSAAGGLTGITRNGAPVSFTTQTIKGVVYAFVPALLGAYEAQYATGGGTTGSATDTTVADFSAGTLDANTRVSQVGDGEVILAAAVNEEFSGSALPAGWSGAPWGGGRIGRRRLGPVDRRRGAGRQQTRRTLRGSRSSSSQPSERRPTSTSASPGTSTRVRRGSIFSTKDTTDTLFARTNTGGGTIDNPIPGSWLGTPHRYRIEWNASSVRFFIDGTLVDTHSVSIGASLRVLASDFNPGVPSLSVDWLRLSPYARPGHSSRGSSTPAPAARGPRSPRRATCRPERASRSRFAAARRPFRTGAGRRSLRSRDRGTAVLDVPLPAVSRRVWRLRTRS